MNPIIQEIKHIFEQSGISLPSFKSIYSNNVEVRELNYSTVYNISKMLFYLIFDRLIFLGF